MYRKLKTGSSLNIVNVLKRRFSKQNNQTNNLTTHNTEYLPIKFEDHYPVMWRNVMRLIEEHMTGLKDPNTYKVFGDFTLGCGNHTQLILDNFPNSFVIGTELDSKIVNHTSHKLDHFVQSGRLAIVEDSYVCVEDLIISDILDSSDNSNVSFSNKKKFDFMLLDLGFNSLQLEDNSKGLSFKNGDSHLDMRYDLDNEDKPKASDILNHASELELMEIFNKYGDEKNYEAIARSIIKSRDEKRIETVGDFIKIIDDTYDYGKELGKYNVYTRLFQALRMTVNYELLNIQRFLNKTFFNMELGGILCVITFHSTEDRLVKSILREMENLKLGKNIIKKAEKACREELEENSRSKSALMRAFRFNPYAKH